MNGTWAPNEGVLMRSCCSRPCRWGVFSMALPGVSPSCPPPGVWAVSHAHSALCSAEVSAAPAPRAPARGHAPRSEKGLHTGSCRAQHRKTLPCTLNMSLSPDQVRVSTQICHRTCIAMGVRVMTTLVTDMQEELACRAACIAGSAGVVLGFSTPRQLPCWRGSCDLIRRPF